MTHAIHTSDCTPRGALPPFTHPTGAYGLLTFAGRASSCADGSPRMALRLQLQPPVGFIRQAVPTLMARFGRLALSCTLSHLRGAEEGTRMSSVEPMAEGIGKPQGAAGCGAVRVAQAACRQSQRRSRSGRIRVNYHTLNKSGALSCMVRKAIRNLPDEGDRGLASVAARDSAVGGAVDPGAGAAVGKMACAQAKSEEPLAQLEVAQGTEGTEAAHGGEHSGAMEPAEAGVGTAGLGVVTLEPQDDEAAAFEPAVAESSCTRISTN